MPARFGLAAMSSKRPLLIDENCEGTGVPTNWSTVSGTPNWDYTAAPLADAQSLYIPSAALAQRSKVNFTDQTEVWIYMLVRLTNGAFPGAGTTYGGLGANGGALVQAISITATNHFQFAGVAASSGTVTLDTTYHMWYHYKQGTGANAIAEIGYSTDGIRPTSGNNFASQSNTAGTNLGGCLFIGPTVTTLGFDVIWDNIRVANSQIGNFGI